MTGPVGTAPPPPHALQGPISKFRPYEIIKKEHFYYRIYFVLFSININYLSSIEYTHFPSNSFLAYFPHLEKMEVVLCELHAVCVCVSFLPTFEWLNQVCISLHLIPSVWVSVCAFPSVAKQQLDNEYTRNNRIIVGPVVFYAVRVVSKESKRLVLPRTCCYLQSSTCLFSSLFMPYHDIRSCFCCTGMRSCF
jgi:hypothetical protein